MKRLIRLAFFVAAFLLTLMAGWVLGGYYALKPTMDSIYQCEQTLPRNEVCVVIVLPKYMIRQAPTAAPTRV